MSHTPGPWTARDVGICDENGRDLFRVYWQGDEMTQVEWSANQKVATAAPDMLDAIRKSLKIIYGGTPDNAALNQIMDLLSPFEDLV